MGIRPRTALTGVALIAGVVMFVTGGGAPSAAREPRAKSPAAPPLGNLIVSRSVYQGVAGTVTVGALLPGGNPLDSTTNFGRAVTDGTYPHVFDNETPDPSFGVTSPIIIDRNALVGSARVPLVSFTVPSDPVGNPSSSMVTSFPSKSEMSLHLSTDGTKISLMGYIAKINELDVSNSNTPGHPDGTNPVQLIYPRGVALIDSQGLGSAVQVTPVNAYSGNNGRSAIVDSVSGQVFLAGNAGNGGSPEPVVLVDNTGLQMFTLGGGPETTVVGILKGGPINPAKPPKNGFQYGFAIGDIFPGAVDKSGKDDNFRGITIFNNTVYVTKGSGGNGIDTVYQVGTAGSLPTPATAASTAITILPGLPAVLATIPAGQNYVVKHPFGIWFANATTLYVADEGDGSVTNLDAGIQKWTFDGSTWTQVYTLQSKLMQSYVVSAPPGGDDLLVTPSGLRTLAGRINGDGTVTLFSVTATVGTLGDEGADPNQIVAITDTLAYGKNDAWGTEEFSVVQTAKYGEVLRGVEFVPVSQSDYVLNALQAALIGVQALPDSDFKNHGEQQSLISVLSGLLSDIQGGTAGNGVPNRLQNLIKKAGAISDPVAQQILIAQLNAVLGIYSQN
jgi:hypothetical protein